MADKKTPLTVEVPALKVHQWLEEWESVGFDEKAHRSRPKPYFFVFSMSAAYLRKLSGIERRTTAGGKLRSQDTGIQRAHDPERSELIGRFVRYGFPWSELSERKREQTEFADLRKPGWLPTAIVINILEATDLRRGHKVDPEHLVQVRQSENGIASIIGPKGSTDKKWRISPSKLPPFEIIDGQHRLLAFDDESPQIDFDLPVVAFHGLDISWQAYLFYTINISPKRINKSLAYDLYPLLRSEEWLEKFEGHSVYRESRAQELVEALWSNPDSPWFHWINMLGEAGGPKMVSQAAWVTSLLQTFIKSWTNRRGNYGGLFGAKIGQHEEVLRWSGAQQAAFLIVMGNELRTHVQKTKAEWAKELRSETTFEDGRDAAFYSSHSLLNSDQGIRGFLLIANDLFFVAADNLRLGQWVEESKVGATNPEEVTAAMVELVKREDIVKFFDYLAKGLIRFDWRSFSAPGLEPAEKDLRAGFRGSSGYVQLRGHLLRTLGKYAAELKGTNSGAGKIFDRAVTFLLETEGIVDAAPTHS